MALAIKIMLYFYNNKNIDNGCAMKEVGEDKLYVRYWGQLKNDHRDGCKVYQCSLAHRQRDCGMDM